MPRSLSPLPSPFTGVFTAGLLAASLSTCHAGAGASTPPSTQPNIVYILADDLSEGDLPLFGRTDIKTPALDRLAAEGMVLRNSYANGPECSPTRAALLTGRYQQRVGGLECAIGTGNVGRYDDAIRLREQDALGLPAAETSLAQVLRRAGYATGLFGKWHLGYGDEFSPNAHGFAEALYIMEGEADYFHHSTEQTGNALRYNGRETTRQGYYTDVVTDAAADFLERHAHHPFFLFVPYTTPHSPFQGPGDARPEPLLAKDPLYRQGAAPPETYRAMLESMDAGVGKLLERLDSLNLTANTIVIFTSDNGGTKSARNTPYRGHKGSVFEGGIRVPVIVRWPEGLPAGKSSNQVNATFDFTRSLMSLGGGQLPAGHQLDGMDIIQHLQSGEPDFPRALYWRGRRGATTWRAIRDGNLKYVRHIEGEKLDEEYLFDLSKDIGEEHNLLNEHPVEAQRLRELLTRWEHEVRPAR